MSDHTRAPEALPPASGSPTGWQPADQEWEHGTLRNAVIEGIARFNEGSYHAAHDVFEDEWFNYGQGTTESAFTHGMVQVAAGAYKYIDRDSPEGMRSLFGTALQYLRGVPPDFYGVDVRAVRVRLTNAIEEPSLIEGWEITVV